MMKQTGEEGNGDVFVEEDIVGLQVAKLSKACAGLGKVRRSGWIGLVGGVCATNKKASLGDWE